MALVAARIRPAAEKDGACIAALLGELGYPASADAIPSRLVALTAERVSIALVAESEGRAVAVITVHYFASIHDDKPVAWITTLAVSSELRKSGIGKALVKAAENWAHDKGCVRISVTAALHRAVAHAFYERLGYSHSGRRYTKVLA
jgi:GNAT superfamily N-acetyltransferase